MEYNSFHCVFFILFELIFSVLFCSKKRREITKQEQSKQMTFEGKEDHNDLLVPFRMEMYISLLEIAANGIAKHE